MQLLQRWPELHRHSTPALYEWLERHRPALFAGVRAASRAGRWEPVNGPWVESDCVLVSSASLWQQFHLGQVYSRRVFPEWTHSLAWLPDSFGFSAGLPAVAERTGVRWFCTHKLAWNADQPFPHRLFRWRSRGGAEVFALMLPPIGRRGEPLDMLNEQRDWQLATGLDQALWIPGVGDHGGGPTDEMLDQMRLWDALPQVPKRRAGTVRDHLASLEPHAGRLPVWRDELYLELHRGCATSRPDQKRHNRTLERLLREVETIAALGGCSETADETADWRPLLFQQFHDILPGTSIPEVFDQAEAVWRSARRKAVFSATTSSTVVRGRPTLLDVGRWLVQSAAVGAVVAPAASAGRGGLRRHGFAATDCLTGECGCSCHSAGISSVVLTAGASRLSRSIRLRSSCSHWTAMAGDSAMNGWRWTAGQAGCSSCVTVRGWISWQVRCSRHASRTAVSSGTPGIWRRITAAIPWRFRCRDPASCWSMAPWSSTPFSVTGWDRASCDWTCDCRPTLPGSS